MGAPGHAESQGQVERQNQLMNQVRCLAQNNVDLWPQSILRIAYAHNTSPNETTGITPYEIVFGKASRTAESVLLKEDNQDSGSTINSAMVHGYVDSLKSTKAAIAKEVHSLTVESQLTRSEAAFRKGDPYKIGDEVRVKLNVAERGRLGGKKMAPVYSDLYVVEEVLGKGWTYYLVPANGIGRRKMRHFNELKEERRSDNMEDTKRINVEFESTPTDKYVIPQRRNGNQRAEQTPAEPRRVSTRTRKQPQRLQMNEISGKRYEEVAVPLTEDVLSGEEEN